MTTLIIGLGNPGQEFTGTRHNTGSVTIDTLAKQARLDWQLDKTVHAEIAETKIGKQKLIFAKPQTMMNGSGRAAAALAKKYKAKPEHIVVIHDDIDIPLGGYKLSFGKRSAGHKGVESVMRALKTKDFWRLRIGIHPPKARKKVDAMKLILGEFTPSEQRTLKKTIAAVLKEYGDALLSAVNPTG